MATPPNTKVLSIYTNSNRQDTVQIDSRRVINTNTNTTSKTQSKTESSIGIGIEPWILLWIVRLET